MKALLATILLASCSTKPIIPTNTPNEQRWEQEYRDGKISWSEYRSLLKAESDKQP